MSVHDEEALYPVLLEAVNYLQHDGLKRLWRERHGARELHVMVAHAIWERWRDDCPRIKRRRDAQR